ncbi:hypothetical protein ACFO25_04500 [Paenactinomyces guangxiensis]|uniref:Uncharacterized protein n=1 Tax=Paenactinomyces guangxiensis TaxID=1490290 RepID=A0A7W2A8B3_9BACL|nr:hypothetical protein [Paenactinomyces guangxiensis]MBA4493638.1 hypothetical protein [Paenactinomyces guangxiensis]MBH8590925.1 hypothetical protein [Paenactinomyces guangxiensis]
MKREILPAWLSSLSAGRNRIWKQRVLIWGKRGLWLGLGLACAILLLARAVPLAHPNEAAGWVLLGGCLTGLIIGVWRKPTWHETVHVIDHRLKLYDRLLTVWQLREQTGPLVSLQRKDALYHLKQKLPQIDQCLPLAWGSKKEGLAILACVALAVLLLFLPNPLTEMARQQEKVVQAIENQQEKIEKQKEQVEKEAKISPEVKQALQKELSQLAEQLKKSETLEQAAAEMAKSEERLNELKKKADQAKAPADKQLSEWMQQEKLASLGKAMSEGGNQPKAQTREEIKQTLQSLTPEEKEKLARQLNQLAEQWSQSASASARDAAKQLQQAAAEIASNSATAAGTLSQAMSAAGTAMNQQQADQQMVSRSQQVVQAGKTTVAAASGLTGTGSNSNGNATSANGSASSNGSSGNQTGGSSLSGSGTGSQPGTGSGNGQGNGSGSGAGSGSGQGNGIGTGAGSRNVLVPWSRINGGGPGETVGGPQGEGTEHQSHTQTTLPGISRPYDQVFTQYETDVRQALERGDLSPELQQIIREYFSSIEP